MSKPYKTCPACGSHLDPGERCDCERKKPRRHEVIMRSATVKRTGMEERRRD